MPFESEFACKDDGDVAIFLVKNENFMHKKENGLDLRAIHKCHIHRKQME